MSQRGIEIDDRETAVVGGTIAAVVLAVVYSVSRVGFESHNPEVLRSLGLSLFLLSLPYWLWRILRRRDSDFVWVRSHPFLGLAVIAFTVLIALAAGPFAASVGLVLSVLGGVGSALVLFSWLRNGALRSRILFTLGAVVLSAWSAGVVWTSRYKLPLYWEQLMTNGNVHHDPLYVVAIGNMLRAYGVASTGLDGIPYTPYHYGTAWLYSRWADLVGTDLLSFYSLGYAVVLIPMFLASIALLAIEARKVSLLSRPLGWLRTNWWGWLALGIGTIGVIPDTALYGMAVWNAHVLISESYLGGLPVFLMAIATALIVWRARSARVPESVADGAAFRACGVRPFEDARVMEPGRLRLRCCDVCGWLSRVQCRLAACAQWRRVSVSLHAIPRRVRMAAVFSTGASALDVGLHRRQGV
jgi:hypothetical protein